MQLTTQVNQTWSGTTQIPLFEAFLVTPPPALLAPQSDQPEDSQPFSEMTLHGTSVSCLHLLAPVLRELSRAQNQRWLTLIAPPANMTQHWLREAGLHRERILVLQPRGVRTALELSCEALRLGCSHTVVSWLAPECGGRARLERAAREGHSHSLNIVLR